MTDPMLALKDRLIMAVLPLVPFEGWTPAALAQAAQSLGLDRSMGERAFPGGPLQALEHFIDLADRRLATEWRAATDVARGGMTARIRWLVRHRIESWADHREAIRRAVSFLSLPHHGTAALRATWRTADLLWHLAGDEAVDFSYYTKRASLSAVYSATLLAWLSDSSEGFVESWDFLDRRLADIAQIPKMTGRLRQQTRAWVKPLTKPIEGLLAAARRRGQFDRHFGIKRT